MTVGTEKKYYITTPIYYVNGLPHVGSALTTISCDVLARYQRLLGNDAYFLTGTDENAPKVQEAAAKAGVPVLDFVNRLAEAFEDCWKKLHIEPNDFIRTTEPRHLKVVQEFVTRLKDAGYVYLDTYEGWYSVSDETFFRDSEVKEGIAIETGKPVVRVQEENYFFKLSAFGDRLLEHIEANPEFLQPEFRKNEVIGFIREGLRDMSITRANKGWGIPVPGDGSKVIYVWFDALINYLAVTGWPDDPNWESRWPADLHFMGKEIFVRFHATLWPAMLMALNLPLPKQVYAHGWWTVQGAKGGKTGASLPHPTRLTQLISDRSGADFDLAADAQRYLLCREMNFGLDTEYSVENCLRRYNTDLANDLGNLLNRTINMLAKFCDGVVPKADRHDTEIVALAEQVRTEFQKSMKEFRLNTALETAWKLVGRMNKYIDERAPWAQAKVAASGDATAANELAVTLYTSLESARVVGVLVSPFMPVASEAVLKQLGISTSSQTLRWKDTEWGGLMPGSRTADPMPIFPRIQELSVDDDVLFALGSANPEHVSTEDQKEGTSPVSDMTNSSTLPIGSPIPPPDLEAKEEIGLIGIEDFMKVHLQVAEILAAEPVPNATKLLRLIVQAGEDDTRTILAGIAEYYTPEELVGRQVVVVANLQPRKMRGIESQGMLLAADLDGRAILLKPDQVVPVGSRVR